MGKGNDASKTVSSFFIQRLLSDCTARWHALAMPTAKLVPSPLSSVATRFGAMPQDITAAGQRLDARDTLLVLLRQTLTYACREAF
ncbi:MAG TPA: hypothetical protein VIH59_14070 [Candidatus Tectomicrobia bacterium]